MPAPDDTSNVLPFPAQVLAQVRAAGGDQRDPHGFVAAATAQAQAQVTFHQWALECAAAYVGTIALEVAFAEPEMLTRETLLLMLRRAEANIRALKAPPQIDPPAPTDGAA